MAKLRSPGVYYEPRHDRVPSLVLGQSGQPGFLGMATRGPLHEPVRITSHEDFLDQYGVPVEGGYLAQSVEGFFRNGGQVCYVVRVAHTFKRGRTAVATVGTHTLLDAEGRPTLKVDASSEGAWGNAVKVSVVEPETKIQTLLTRDLTEGENHVQVRSTRGLHTGTIVRLSDGKNVRYVTILRADGKEISWHEGIDVGFKSSAPTHVEPVSFDMLVEVPGYREVMRDLSFSPLSGRYFERYINAESQLIRVTNVESTSDFPASLPTPVEGIQLDGGTDGLTDLTAQDFIGFNNGPGHRFGLGALEIVDDVDLVAIPDLFAAMELSKGRGFRSYKDVQAVQEAMVIHCEKLQDRFAILDVPPRASYEQCLQWRQMFDTSYAALYFPWLVINTQGRRRFSVPPSGYVAGVMARTDLESGVYKPPANEDVRGIIDLDVNLNDTHLALLNKQGVNCIRIVPGRGIRVWGARTISSDPQWKYVNVRRAFVAVRNAVEHGTQWTVFEPNGPNLWSQVERLVSAFLHDLFLDGYFKGNSPSEGFYVRCDAETNPVEDVNAGVLRCEIGIAPVRPAEYIIFHVDQDMEDRGEEVAAGRPPS